VIGFQEEFLVLGDMDIKDTNLVSFVPDWLCGSYADNCKVQKASQRTNMLIYIFFAIHTYIHHFSHQLKDGIKVHALLPNVHNDDGADAG